ncbi:MAG: stage II sporulation protein M [Candidatus Thermoplasmatota archaeon]|nr:stage II sporulation protein M [Candidatus Thermoplasmatota archaeon]
MEPRNFLFRNGVLKVGGIAGILFIAEMAIFIYVSSLSISNPAILSQVRQEQSRAAAESLLASTFSIFSNNFRIASVEFIPILGQAFFFYTIYSTAVVFSVEGPSLNASGLAIFLSLLLFTYSWLELPSYAIASSTGVYIIYMLAAGKGVVKNRLKKVVSLYLFVGLELLVAAFFESLTIEFGNSGSNGLLLIFLLWLPGVPVIIFLIKLFRRICYHDNGKTEPPAEVSGHGWNSL